MGISRIVGDGPPAGRMGRFTASLVPDPVHVGYSVLLQWVTATISCNRALSKGRNSTIMSSFSTKNASLDNFVEMARGSLPVGFRDRDA